MQLLPHFEVWSNRACQPLQMWQISHFCEIHSLSYEASKFFAMLSLCVIFGRYFAPGANIVPPIAYKSHSTPFPIRPHVLTPHSWLCDKNCGRSSAPKKKWNLEMADNTNVALPYMASTINKGVFVVVVAVLHTHKHTHFQLDRVLLKHWNYWGLALKLLFAPLHATSTFFPVEVYGSDAIRFFILSPFKRVIWCNIHFSSCLNINVCWKCVHIHPIIIKVHPVFFFLNPGFKIPFLQSGCSESPVRMTYFCTGPSHYN